MSDIKQLGLAALVGGVATLALIQSAVAAEEDALHFTVSQRFERDSNVFRWAHNEKSDWISTTRAGLNFNKEYSRQGLHANLSVGRQLYQDNTRYNNTSPNADLRWDWRVGDHWSGVLGYSYGESFVGFADYRGTERVLRRIGRANVGADYWFHPDWALGANFSSVRNNYRDSLLPYDKYEANEENLNLTYRPSTGNRIVLSLRNEDGQYPNQLRESQLQPGQESLREWNQRDVRLSGSWQLTGASLVSGYVGYAQRKYDLASDRDFRGVMGSVALHWVPSSKVAVDLSWRREIGADIDSVANYAVTHSWFLQPTWVMTDKVHLSAYYQYMTRDYGGDPGSGGAGVKRDGRSQFYGLTFRYLPTSYANLELGVNRYRNKSLENIESLDYRGQSTWLSGNITF